MAGELLKAGEVLRVGQELDFYLEDGSERYPSRILAIKADKMFVVTPKDRSRQNLALVPNTEMKALIVEADCRYSFRALFEQESTHGVSAAWQVAVPDQVERFQTRGNVRVKASLPLEVRLVDEEGAISAPQRVQMLDLSGSGLCFRLDHAASMGMQVGMEIANIPAVGTIDVMGRIVRCVTVDESALRPKYDVGVEFGHLSRAVTNKIVNYLFSVQRKAISKGRPVEADWT